DPLFPLPDLHALRASIAAIASSLGARLPDGSKIDIGGLSAKLDVEGEQVAFGPGPFTLERRADVVRLAFTSGAGDRAEGSGEAGAGSAAGTPLSVDAEIPLGGRDVVARLSGGPVSLAVLGVKEGTKGLFDVAHGMVSGRGQLTLAAAGDALT